ncbi:uncharacterized protein LOC128992454 [Macrosteles quadrilineatus]|uniref:uncharacterized protein LOC128992454 n=1 Tax=Macrosteles quadrilineatus TaxID=74068 RepID=UPI0023E1C6E7|nr:uncharacterized protein LOC128992454 [Macrosteles quadrilineatus]
MFEDFDSQNNQKQEEDEDSETCYSYPSYSRFTYTGKTKSRLGRNRFLKQTGTKDESKKTENDCSTSSDLKSNDTRSSLQTNSQITKTPGISWLQRESYPFTPGAKSNSVHASSSDINSLPSQPNFLFNLKNDSVESSSCKRNLPFSTTPFKSKVISPEKRIENSALRELNQLRKPENPFSKLDFFNRPKEENKENSKTDGNMKNSELTPSWNQLKQICDAAISRPDFSKHTNSSNPVDLRKSNEHFKSSLFAPPFSVVERKDDDSSSNMPLDLSSAESMSNKTFSRSLISGNDNVDGDSSGSYGRLLSLNLKNTSKESELKKEDSITQKTNTDALSGFLPQFLVPTNKTSKPGSTEDDDSHSMGTVIQKMFDFQPQTPYQKTQVPSQAPNKMPCENSSGDLNRGNEVHSTSLYESLNYDVKKSSPPSLPTNFIFKNTSPPLQSNNPVQSSNQPKFYHTIEQKLSPPTVPGSLVSTELSPSVPNAQNVRNLVTNGQQLLNDDQNSANDKKINLLAQGVDMNLRITEKPNQQSTNEVADKSAFHLKNANVVSYSKEKYGFNQSKSNAKPLDHISPPNNSQKFSSDNVQKNSEPLSNLYQSAARPEMRLMAPIALERNMSQSSVQQTKPMIDQEPAPASYARPEIVQPQSQRTYLAPQQVNHNGTGNFPHIKPEVPQLAGSKPSFSTAKKPSQFKMSGPRGMPSRADTELSVNGKSYTILSMLGKGGSSEVYQVLDPCSSKLLAVKCVDLSMVDKTIADGYLNEIELLSRLQGCASVIRMFDYEYVQECKMLYVVMEKGDTDLSHLIRDISKTKKISMSMIIYYWTEMLQAVKDIHDQGIIHSDLKPANFLLVSGRLKLIDFGIASSQGDMTSVVKEVTTGTWNYMSPEAIKNTSASGKGFKITYKSDVWSLGCILYNLVYGKTPFSHITNTWGKLSAIADPNHCIEFPDVGAPLVLVKALQSCFHREPKLRPTVAELLSLPYHSTGDTDLTNVGRQVQTILPTQWWTKVAHLFPGVKSIQEGKHPDNGS